MTQAHPYPWHVERAYIAHCRTRVLAVHALTAELIAPVFAGVDSGAKLTLSMVARAVSAVDRAEQAVRGVPPNVIELGGFARQITGWAKNTLRRELPDERPVPTGLIAEQAWTAENVRLLESIDRRYFEDMRKAIIETDGGLVGDLAAVLRVPSAQAARLDTERANGRISMVGPHPVVRRTPLEVSLGRANVVGQDQVGKGAGAFNMEAQQAAGITHYRWITQADEKVRPEHRRRHNKTFAWARPPSDGHPGQSVNCRCFARPVTRVARAQSRLGGRIRL